MFLLLHFSHAHDLAIDTRIKYLIVILLEDVRDTIEDIEGSENIAPYLRLRNFIDFRNTQNWDKLRYAMPQVPLSQMQAAVDGQVPLMQRQAADNDEQ